ncbi:MAG: M23 family metallopeptidase [Bacilli bacterium]|nr:M23 family metallopeptidase [Bacilli bacterium]
MTYEEYKNNKNPKEHKIIKVILNKLFTIIIFTMIIVIISNLSPKFREFVYNNVLNNSLDFSFVNKILEKTSNVFKEEQTKQVFNEIKEYEPYKDGIKYKIKENENIYLKDSGIVTYIGEKEGYNNTVIIQQSNGYYAWYGNIKENVKLYDYVESGTQIGTASNEYYYVLLKDDKPVSIHD